MNIRALYTVDGQNFKYVVEVYYYLTIIIIIITIIIIFVIIF